MSRLPSAAQLDQMTPINQWSLLDKFAADLSDERVGILSGSIMPWGGATRRSILNSNRMRIKRLRAIATEFNVGINHHFERGRPVPMASLPLR
jgi:hypothetical protein